MDTLSFWTDQWDAAKSLVQTYHYTHRFPSNVQFVGTWHEPGGLFGDKGPAVAACIFSIPPTRWSAPVWELSRLVRREDIRPSLSGLIAACCAAIRRSHLQDLLISFADVQAGHHGGIYQASSWQYAGCREPRMDGLIVNGAFVPGRSANSTWGTRSPERLRGLHPAWTIEPSVDKGKHLYWKALSKRGVKRAEELGLACHPYPKPGGNGKRT